MVKKSGGPALKKHTKPTEPRAVYAKKALAHKAFQALVDRVKKNVDKLQGSSQMVMYNHHERNMWGSGGYNVGSLDDDLEKFTAAVQKVMAYARELRDLGEQDEDDKLKSKLGISKEGEMMGLEHTFLVTVHALSATVIQTHDSIGRIEEVPAEEELDTDELFDALSNIYTNVEKFFVIIKSISPPNTNSDREDDDDDEVIDLTSSNDNEMEEQKKGWTLVAAYDFGGHEPSEHATQFLRPSEELAIVLQNARKAEAW